MAGGVSTPGLVVAAARAGALGFLAGGYKSSGALAEQIAAVRSETENFGVNLFVPDSRPVDAEALAAYRTELAAEAERYGVPLPELNPEADDDGWQQKLELLGEQPVAFVSFTFGAPAREEVRSLQALGSKVLITVTSGDEAKVATERGADALIVQHSSAGGHSGAFLDPDKPEYPDALADLLIELRSVSPLPLIGAGGISDSTTAAMSLDCGAEAVQLGTAFLCATEAGTREAHRQALLGGRFIRTARTRAFSGRWARGLENRFIREHPGAPQAYPQIHHLTSPLRAAAAAAGDPEGVNLWAGTGFAQARAASTAEILADLESGL
ncbi:nitronate monooxygenase [Psychromicrobium silvestre]|uniref:Propionate 3-nitronate monooxygenase n=2 Tax=Psychromicrobium silvestre TaxID=1645614 RepID=A0A7Y9LT50_9MICC|nr:nitronate monooxygenase [Psychromicrobium silvestre]